jgi:hypothetical protein
VSKLNVSPPPADILDNFRKCSGNPVKSPWPPRDSTLHLVNPAAASADRRVCKRREEALINDKVEARGADTGISRVPTKKKQEIRREWPL